MNGLSGHDSALVRLYWTRKTCANDMNFGINHAPGGGSIAQPLDPQSSALLLYYGYPPTNSGSTIRQQQLDLRQMCILQFYMINMVLCKIIKIKQYRAAHIFNTLMIMYPKVFVHPEGCTVSLQVSTCRCPVSAKSSLNFSIFRDCNGHIRI